MTDEQFLTLLNTILLKHDCFISEANIENKVLFIEGKDKNLEACAIEIETILGDYINA